MPVTTFYANFPLRFFPPLQRGLLSLQSIQAEAKNNQWVALQLHLRTDASTYSTLLASSTGWTAPTDTTLAQPPFHASLPVYLTLTLKDNYIHELPDVHTPLVAYVESLTENAPLLHSDRWTLTAVQQPQPTPYHMPDLNGEGQAAPPHLNEADLGPISQVIYQALIHAGLPFSYHDDHHRFELTLNHQNRLYHTQLLAHDVHFRLSLTLHATPSLPERQIATATDLLQAANEQLSIGHFSIQNHQLTYFEAIDAPRDYTSKNWISPLLATALQKMIEQEQHLTTASGHQDS